MAVITYAQAAALALSDAMAGDSAVIALGEDVGRGGIFGQYRGLIERFGPSRIIDTPISEATIVGAAVGMALSGMRPVVELRVVDFALCAMDEIVNQAAKNRFMFGGQSRVPVVLRMPMGIWTASAAQHSQSLESWFAHIPGLVVMAPATPQDNHDLLRAAIDCGDPVAYLEHKELWGLEGAIEPEAALPIGRARRLREGADLTIVSWSRMVHACTQACDALASQGVRADLLDLRTLWPWDREAVLSSALHTGHLLVVHEAVQVAGFGAEVAASVAELAHDVRVARLGAMRIPVGYSAGLEAQARTSVEQIVARALALVS